VSVSKTKSKFSYTITNLETGTYIDRQLNAAVFSLADHKMSESNSATSMRGYDNNMSIWATAHTLLLAGMMNRHTRKTREVFHILDEPFLAKIYTKIMTELYGKGNSTPLPAVQGNEV